MIHFVDQNAMKGLANNGIPVQKERGSKGKQHTSEKLVSKEVKANFKSRFTGEEIDVFVNDNKRFFKNLRNHVPN